MAGSNHKDALQLFKTKISDLAKPEYTDHFYMKWLKARNFDVDKAVTMFRNSMEYRRKIQMDTLIRTYTPPEVLQKYLPGGFCGYDKEGSPVLVELYGYTDMKGILHSVKKSDIEKTKLLLGERVMEMLDQQTKKVGKYVDGMTVIIDMDNVGSGFLWIPGIQMYAHMGRILQDNYPEIVKRTFLVNGNYKKELLKLVDPDQLPAFLGGTQTDPDGDPRCKTKIVPGGQVPESYYLKELVDTDSMQQLVIARGDKKELRFPVHVADSLFRWEFQTDGYDLGFGVHFEAVTGRQTLTPVERVNSHMVPEDGTLTCKRTGTYILLFDNSYSWARSKTVYYNADVVAPDDGDTMTDLDQVTQGGSWERIAKETLTTWL